MSEEETVQTIESEGRKSLRDRLIFWLARGDVVILNCTMHCPLGWELHANKIEPKMFMANTALNIYDPRITTLESIPHTRIFRTVVDD